MGLVVALAWPAARVSGQRTIDVLESVWALPAQAVSRFPPDSVYVAAPTGDYAVLDKRDHRVYLVDPDTGAVRPLVEIGMEPGRIFQATAMALTDNFLAVADVPRSVDRIQYFSLTGVRLGGFYLSRRETPRLTIEDVLVDRAGSLAFTGTSFLVNRPEWGSLFTELDTTGEVIRSVGLPRSSGEPEDRDLELAMNTGIPLPDPTGGFFFVFQTGVPMFRKYDADGRLLFSRHVEGPELDALIQTLPTTWAPRPEGAQPLVRPLVRAAAVDARGRLWISLVVPYTYVYDGQGEKTRTVQFRAAGLVSPLSLFFTQKGRLLIGPGGYEFAVE